MWFPVKTDLFLLFVGLAGKAFVRYPLVIVELRVRVRCIKVNGLFVVWKVLLVLSETKQCLSSAVVAIGIGIRVKTNAIFVGSKSPLISFEAKQEFTLFLMVLSMRWIKVNGLLIGFQGLLISLEAKQEFTFALLRGSIINKASGHARDDLVYLSDKR